MSFFILRKVRKTGSLFFVLWVLLNALGAAIGYGIAELAVMKSAGRLSWLFSAFLYSAVLGVTLGMMQWLVLRRWIPGSKGWIAATIAGGALSGFFLTAVYQTLDLTVSLGVFGLAIGITQLFVLWRSLRLAGLWPVVSALSWWSGALIAQYFDQVIFRPDHVTGALSFLLVCLFHGLSGFFSSILTGLALRWMLLLKKARQAQQEHY
ncbi:hypothetical protein ACFLU6_06105 [Acidobacteriota bacterium]